MYTNTPELCSEGFVVLPGIEFDASRVKNLDRAGRPSNIGYHENAILCDFDNTRQFPDNYRETYGDVYPEGTTLKEGISLFNEKYQSLGNMVILNHPVWSRQTCEDAYGLRGIFAMEIYNHSSEAGNKTGLAVTHWDYCLRRGQRLFCVATDDFHLGLEPKGYIMVKAETLTQRAIAKAIKEGRFYASNGPEIFEFYLEGHTVVLRCSPVKTIRFIKYEPMGTAFHAEKGGYLTQAVTGVNGRKNTLGRNYRRTRYTAWTNPIIPVRRTGGEINDKEDDCKRCERI